MFRMTKLGKLWTGAVAYVSLGVGAGLSVAGNLADTYRTRGAATDTLDQVMAAGWPVLVLLAIEMFVSPRWSDKRMFQVWRWTGCLAVGGMAMVVSWTHLHDLMASRGQMAVVAILGPLAIDGMAIMATGLILSTRGHVATDTDIRTLVDNSSIGHVATVRTPDTDGHLSADMATWAPDMSGVRSPMERMSMLPDMVRWPEDMAVWSPGDIDPTATQPLSPDGEALAEEAEGFLATQADALPRRTRIPDEAVRMIRDWDRSPALLVAELAQRFDISSRTARRWRGSVS
jgi:hypothetical protein